ncbi:MAG: hypothetical protein Q8K12_12545 [Thiobacillus sp.]|nr:hypothetical protein [Thiobacillus sp.]
MKYGVGFVSCAFLFWATQSSAQVVMSASCSEPLGVRYDQVKGKTEKSDDGFSSVRPQFVLSKGEPLKLTVIWPDSSTLGKNAKQQAHEATVVDINDEMVTAIALYEHRVNLYTLFPNKGIAFMSTHKNIPLQGGIPSGSIFKLECKFELN